MIMDFYGKRLAVEDQLFDNFRKLAGFTAHAHGTHNHQWHIHIGPVCLCGTIKIAVNTIKAVDEGGQIIAFLAGDSLDKLGILIQINQLETPKDVVYTPLGAKASVLD